MPAVSQLDLAEASMLAGLPQSPSYYDPTVNKSVALDRQKEVLQSMLDQGMITDKQAHQAEQEMAKFTFKPFKHDMQAPHFVQYVIDQVLVPLLGAQNLYDGGLNNYTTGYVDLEIKDFMIVNYNIYQMNRCNNLDCYGPLDTRNKVANVAGRGVNPMNGA